MNTNQLKHFATEARNKLKAGIAAKITTLGFDAKGNVSDRMKPELIQNGSIWNGNIQTEAFYYQWMSLYERVQQKGINEVYEEAAYTWFNRLVAIRILQKNGLTAPVMEYADSARTPKIVDDARQGRFPQMPEQMRSRLVELLEDDTKVTEQFALLISAWCHQNPIINACFGGIADYTELLLPNNILAEGQFIDLLNHTEFITDADYRSPELIGWLYQFYISERKDEVFAKKGKFEADEIPAATQIFTPNWIVKYMVQNTIGRIYLDNNSSETQLKDKWKYLVEPSQPTSKESILRYGELTNLKAGDLASGSGHILNEAFDIFYDLYILEGYSRKEAIENIFRYNLTGVDLDTRAKQLAMFALLLKACQKDSSFADAHILPRVLDMPKPYDAEKNGPLEGFLHHFFRGEETRQMVNELTDAFNLMKDADSLGSIMKFDLSDSTRLLVKQTMEYWERETAVPEIIQEQMPAFRLILALTETYSALVMNPPYMGSGNMNSVLSKYVKDNYEEGKADLFSTFMLLSIDRLAEKGKYGMINMQSWMFLSSFESLRKIVIDDTHIDNMLHLGPRTFDELSGEVVQNTAFVITNEKPSNGGTYFRLVDGKDCGDKERMFIGAQKSLNGFEKNPIGKNNFSSMENSSSVQSVNQIRFDNVSQKDFYLLNGIPLSYWVSEQEFKAFDGNSSLGEIAEPRAGLQTSDNPRFLRLWFEVSTEKVSYNLSREEALSSDYKWFPHNKGGSKRRWYGNRDYIINFYHDGEELKYWLEHNPNDPTTKSWSRNLRNYPLYFKEGITWSAVSSNSITFRYTPKGSTFDTSGPMLFSEEHLKYILGLANSKVLYVFAKIFSQGLSIGSGHIANVPFIDKSSKDILHFVDNNIFIAKLDWDAHETSWDFQQNELVAINDSTYVDIINEIYEGTGIMVDLAAPQSESLEWRVGIYKEKWQDKFNRLHDNEEELNRQFINIYGLEDELTPDVPLSEITILQDGEISIENETLTWHEDVLMKQLISYAVGCWMGRYRLDKPGLYIAHPDPSDEELSPYMYHGEQFEIDDDGIIPIMTNDCGFSDNASIRFSDFIRTVMGEQKHVENLNYVEHKLGKSIEQYFVKDFWKDHKKMYQNRPIYWLFSSKKGTFQVLVYMHRMNAYTAERVRAKYLLPFIEHLQAHITELDNRAATLSTKENKQLETMRKQLDECREYHDRLQVIAEQAISFDLDDGVLVNYAKFGDVLAKIK
jgi:hypothetical protein